MRVETPEARTLRFLNEDPDLLESCAKNLYENLAPPVDMGEAPSWRDLHERERQQFRDQVMRMAWENAANPGRDHAEENREAFRRTLERNERRFSAFTGPR